MDLYVGGGITNACSFANYDYNKYDIKESPFIYKKLEYCSSGFTGLNSCD